MNRALTLLVALMLATACREPDGHTHGNGEAHSHGAPEDERPTLSVTVYESGLELFMEYPAFVAGEVSPLVAHFTDAGDPEGFRVVTTGSVTATLRWADGTEEQFVAKELLRDGIFKPAVRPSKAGKATLALRLEGTQAQGLVHVGEVVVHPTREAAIAAAPKEEAGEPTISYLKETQWRTQYATAPAEPRTIEAGVRANAEIKPVAGLAAELSAPVAGRVLTPGPVPHLGQQVRKGQLLATVAPIAAAASTSRALLELDLARARSELALAEKEVARAEGLLAQQAVPEKQVDEARAARDVARASVLAAERQLATMRGAQGGGSAGATFEIRSPITGVIAFADVTPGAVVEAGSRLLSIVNTERVWLEARVFESDVPSLEGVTGAVFTVAGSAREFSVDTRTGRRVAIGAVIDPRTRTVPVIFELPNPKGILKPGMFAKATLFTGRQVRALAVPEQAIVDDNGRPTVFVMDGGESFFKRRVRIGARSGGWVQVLDGVREGERVVSRGAYEVLLSTASGALPEHGHQH